MRNQKNAKKKAAAKKSTAKGQKSVKQEAKQGVQQKKRSKQREGTPAKKKSEETNEGDQNTAIANEEPAVDTPKTQAQKRDTRDNAKKEDKTDVPAKTPSRLTLWQARSQRGAVMENFAALIHSGMGVAPALTAMSEEARNKPLQKTLSWLREQVMAGVAFWQALERIHFVPAHQLALVRIGEENGRLNEYLDLIAQQIERDRRFRATVRSAALYPALVTVTAGVVALGVAWYLIPRLTSLFDQLQVELPLTTRWLIWLGNGMAAHGWWAVPLAIVAVAIAVYFLFFFSRTKRFGESLLLRLPGTGRVMREIELARMGFVLGHTLKAGVGIDQALDAAARGALFYPYRQLLTTVRNNVVAGRSIHATLKEYPGSDRLVPVSARRLIATGEEAGSLPEVLTAIGERYERSMQETSKSVAALLEPALLIVVWLAVLFIAVSVISPLYGMISSVRNFSNPANLSSTAPARSKQTGAVSPSDMTAVEEAQAPPPATAASSSPLTADRSVTILKTGAGYLNVRQAPTTASERIGRVTPGETYPLVRQTNGWYQITFTHTGTSTNGWVYGSYVTITPETHATTTP